jgi:uncharacterized metal-binding protein YceD (DUF177 family)
MSKFEQYNILLKDLPVGKTVKEFILCDVFFHKIDSPEVQKGNVKATVTIHKKENSFELAFHLNGTILIPCDRCLDDMEQDIIHKENVLVKFGNKFSAEDDEIVIVPESEGAINIAWFLYEFIILNIPIKHVHAPGLCNKTMMSKLKKHIVQHKDEENDDENESFDLGDNDDFVVDE